MASLTPGILLKLVKNVDDKEAKVVGEHRSALLQAWLNPSIHVHFSKFSGEKRNKKKIFSGVYIYIYILFLFISEFFFFFLFWF